jgi:hypothetical protein
MAVIGLLNMWPFGFSESRVLIIVGYLLAGVFVVLSYKLVALADNLEQEGGAKPITFFGRPRSRRLFFAALIYSPVGPLIPMSIIWSDAPWCPILLRPPQFWLLLVVLLSALSAVLIFHRYRRVERNQARARRVVAAVTLLVLGLAAAAQIVSMYDAYMYALSSVTLTCIAATVHWSLGAKEGPKTAL